MSRKESMENKFARMQEIVQSDAFLSQKGIISEVPFFIFAYSPSEEIQVQKQSEHLVKSLKSKGVGILEVNLYDLCVDLIKERNLWDKLLEMEKGWEKDKFRNQLRNLIDVSEKMIPEISKRIEQADGLQILLLTGVGQVYPFIRTHSVLNNLQRVAKDYPTLLFFPGEYTFNEGRGQSLDLFGVLNEDKYYRAFNIMEYKLPS
jgi:hypothetical protein